jgi:hypothetical protein
MAPINEPGPPPIRPILSFLGVDMYQIDFFGS